MLGCHPSPHTNDLPKIQEHCTVSLLTAPEKEAIAIQLAGLSAREDPMQVQLFRRQLPAADS